LLVKDVQVLKKNKASLSNGFEAIKRTSRQSLQKYYLPEIQRQPDKENVLSVKTLEERER
jgi:hypothetical protein